MGVSWRNSVQTYFRQKVLEDEKRQRVKLFSDYQEVLIFEFTTFCAFLECFCLHEIIKLSELYSQIFYTIKVMAFLGEWHKDFMAKRKLFKLELIM